MKDNMSKTVVIHNNDVINSKSDSNINYSIVEKDEE